MATARTATAATADGVFHPRRARRSKLRAQLTESTGDGSRVTRGGQTSARCEAAGMFEDGREARERIDTVVISAGFHKTHVTTAASEASVRGLLRLAITAAYPTETVKRIARFLRLEDRGRLARLLEREERIPSSRISALFVPELLDEGARLIAPVPLIGRLYARLSVATWRLYGRLVARKLGRAAGARIYHFR